MTKWFINKYGSKCECGKQSLILKEYTQYFNVGYEWEDSITDYYCPTCEVKNTYRSIKFRMKKKIKKVLTIVKFCIVCVKNGHKIKFKTLKCIYKM